jgi:hypothetical protein
VTQVREEILTEAATADLANWRLRWLLETAVKYANAGAKSTNTRGCYSIWRPDDEDQVERHLIVYGGSNHAVHLDLAGPRDWALITQRHAIALLVDRAL